MRALNHLRPVGTGASEPQIFHCDDGQLWVLKLPGNPQRTLLGADLLGTLLADRLGVPVPQVAVADVDADALTTIRPPLGWATTGPAFASRFLENARNVAGNDALAASATCGELGALLVADSWIETLDRRCPDGEWNLLLRTDQSGSPWIAIDFGYSMQHSIDPASDLMVPANYPDAIRRLASRASVSDALERLDALAEPTIQSLIDEVPSEWMNTYVKGSTLKFLRERRTRLLSVSADRLLGR